jgi:hypothetical protein
MNRRYLRVWLCGEEAEQKVVTYDRRRLRAAGASPWSPHPRKEQGGPGIVQGEPGRHRLATAVVVFAEGGCGHQAAVSHLQPGLPPRAGGIAAVGDWPGIYAGRRREGPRAASFRAEAFRISYCQTSGILAYFATQAATLKTRAR